MHLIDFFSTGRGGPTRAAYWRCRRRLRVPPGSSWCLSLSRRDR